MTVIATFSKGMMFINRDYVLTRYIFRSLIRFFSSLSLNNSIDRDVLWVI